MGDSALRAQNPIFKYTFDNIPPYRTFAQAMNDPATVALGASRATKASTRDFCMLYGARDLNSHLAHTSYEVRTRPVRPVQKGTRRWRMRVRPGPPAIGGSSSYMEPFVSLGFANLWGRCLFPDRRVTPHP